MFQHYGHQPPSDMLESGPAARMSTITAMLTAETVNPRPHNKPSRPPTINARKTVRQDHYILVWTLIFRMRDRQHCGKALAVGKVHALERMDKQQYTSQSLRHQSFFPTQSNHCTTCVSVLTVLQYQKKSLWPNKMCENDDMSSRKKKTFSVRNCTDQKKKTSMAE